MDNDPRLKLKRKIHELKVNNLVNNFAKKISMNSAERNPVDYSPFEDKVDTSEGYNGLEIPNFLNNIYNVISLINIIVILVVASLSIIFEQTMKNSGVMVVEIIGVCWLVIEIAVNFVKVSYSKGYYKLEKIREIAKDYARRRFWIDLICLTGLTIDIISDF